MVVPLEREELVDGPNGSRVGGPDPQRRSPRQGVDRIRDGRPPGSHDLGPRHRPRVDEARQGEITSGEPPGDLVHVPADLGGTSLSATSRCSAIRPPSGSGSKTWRDVYWFTPMATPPRACTPAKAESPALIEAFGEALGPQAAKANARCTIELLRIEPPTR